MEKKASRTPHGALIVGLTPQMQAVLQEWLEEKGYVTLAAADGVEMVGPKCLSSTNVRVLLADTILKIVRREPNERHTAAEDRKQAMACD